MALVRLSRMADDDPAMILGRLAMVEKARASRWAPSRRRALRHAQAESRLPRRINGIVYGAQLYHIPLLMMISRRGENG